MSTEMKPAESLESRVKDLENQISRVKVAAPFLGVVVLFLFGVTKYHEIPKAIEEALKGHAIKVFEKIAEDAAANATASAGCAQRSAAAAKKTREAADSELEKMKQGQLTIQRIDVVNGAGNVRASLYVDSKNQPQLELHDGEITFCATAVIV